MTDSTQLLARILDAGYSDVEFLIKKMDEFNIEIDDVLDRLEDMGFEEKNLNQLMYATFDLAEQNFKSEVRTFMEDNYGKLDLDLDFIDEYESRIYTNFMDSFYDSKLENYDLTNFSEDNIKNFVEDIIDDKNYFNKLDIKLDLLEIEDNIDFSENLEDITNKLKSYIDNDDYEISEKATELTTNLFRTTNDNNLKDNILLDNQDIYKLVLEPISNDNLNNDTYFTNVWKDVVNDYIESNNYDNLSSYINDNKQDADAILLAYKLEAASRNVNIELNDFEIENMSYVGALDKLSKSLNKEDVLYVLNNQNTSKNTLENLINNKDSEISKKATQLVSNLDRDTNDYHSKDDNSILLEILDDYVDKDTNDNDNTNRRR